MIEPEKEPTRFSSTYNEAFTAPPREKKRKI